MSTARDLIVVGGGAAGFFTAINIAQNNPSLKITILEKSGKLLSKVKVSGGGRCNVTNEREQASELIHFYPRGHKKLYNLFQSFSTTDMRRWLADRGIKTNAEADKRVFPISNDSQTIIDCFLGEAKKYQIDIRTKTGVTGLKQTEKEWQIETDTENFSAQKVIVATGGSRAAWSILSDLGLKIVPPVPSLFTFNIKDERLSHLMGISFPKASLKITSSKFESDGPLLITHWGLSGPAILKLSAWAARELASLKYQFEIIINFLGDTKPEEFKKELLEIKSHQPKKKVKNFSHPNIATRFWDRICQFCEISANQPFGELNKKQLNKLTEELTQGRYAVHGKSTFKEEFVTSGGVALSEINLESFEAKRFPGLYLAGEVIDIDALTGGFNFQACWSAGFLISRQF